MTFLSLLSKLVPEVPAFAAPAPFPNVYPMPAVNTVSIKNTHIVTVLVLCDKMYSILLVLNKTF